MRAHIRGSETEIIEIFETFKGDLYFIAEYINKEGDIFCYARLRSMPDCAEWGYNNINYLKRQYGHHMIWCVKKKDWGNIDTYEKGLLVIDYLEK